MNTAYCSPLMEMFTAGVVDCKDNSTLTTIIYFVFTSYCTCLLIFRRRGQLGNGEIVAVNDRPCVVNGLAGVKVIDIAADGWHSAAVSAFGDLYTWGWNNQGQLGLQDPQHRERVVSLPQLVSFSGEEDLMVEKVHCGIGHTVVEVVGVDRKKQVWCAGWNLETRFTYSQASLSANFGGFRKLDGPVQGEAEQLEVGAGSYQVYFLQRDQN